MESQSSINIQNISNNPYMHNSRAFESDYLITSVNHQTNTYKQDLIAFKQEIIADYESHNRGTEDQPKYQKWQKHSAPLKEAVVNTKVDTTMEDLERLKEQLEANFGVEVLQISNHKDEGHFIITDDKSGIEYHIERKYNKKFKSIKDGTKVNHIIINPNTKEEIEISGSLKRKHNYHAHVVMSKYNFKAHKITKWNKSDLKRMQTMVAGVLGMERGTRGSKNKHINHHQYVAQQEQEQFSIDILNNIKLTQGSVKNYFKEQEKIMVSLGIFTKNDYDKMRKSRDTIIQNIKAKKYESVDILKKDLNKSFTSIFKTQQQKLSTNQLNAISQKIIDNSKSFKIINEAKLKENIKIYLKHFSNNHTQEIKDLKKDTSTKDQEIQTLKKQLDTKDQEIKDLKNNINSLKNDNMRLSITLNKQKDLIAKAKEVEYAFGR